MTNIEVTKLGPGELKFNPEDSLKDFSVNTKSVEFKPEKPESEVVVTLSGDHIVSGNTDLKGSLSVTFAQDFEQDGLVAWTYANHGKAVPVIFRPVKTKNMQLKGTATIVATNLGGTPGQVNDAQAEFEVTGVTLTHDGD